MSATENTLQVKFLQSNPIEARLVKYFKILKSIAGLGAKSEILRAVMSFFYAIAMANDPLVSDAEVEQELMKSLIAMSSQMSAIVSYCRIKRGIKLTAEMFATFGLKPELNFLVQPASLAVPAVVVESKPPSKVEEVVESKPPVKVEEVVAIEPDEEEEDEDEEEDDDDDDEFDRIFLDTLRNPPPLVIEGQVVPFKKPNFN